MDMKLTPTNYYTPEVDRIYMSNSQYGTFNQCPARAVAELAGDYTRPYSTALLQGSYVDAWVEGTLDYFVEDHPELISSRGPTKGKLKAEFKQLDQIIERLQRDDFFMSYLVGDKQTIVTGEIAGVPFKGKLDVFDLPTATIVDFKTVRDFHSIWDDQAKERKNFIQYWGYDRQLAIYRELIRQNTGIECECFIAAVTKETVPDLEVIHFTLKELDLALQEVEFWAPQYQAIKDGAEAERCGKCDWCKATKKLTHVIRMEDLEV